MPPNDPLTHSHIVMPADLPMVGILPYRNMLGINNLSDQMSPLVISPLLTAMQTRHETDAHFISYIVTNATVWPRINKAALPRIIAAGEQILSTSLVVEYDNPNHAPWTPGAIDQFLAKMDAVGGHAMDWTFFYTTRAGARFIWVYSVPVSVELSELHMIGMQQHLVGLGLTGIDTTIKDWTRAWRLPYVLRDQTCTWENPAGFEFLVQINRRLDPATAPTAKLGVAGSAMVSGTSKPFDDPKPSPDYADRLLWIRGQGPVKGTDFYHAAKRRLLGRNCYPCLFAHAPLAEVGSRGSTLLSYVAGAVTLLHKIPETRPEQVYALFLPMVQQLEPARDVRDWTDELWRHVGNYWAKEEARAQATAAVELAASVEGTGAVEKITHGMRAWCTHPDMDSDDLHTRTAFVERHLIASHGNFFYLMREDGFYSPAPTNQGQLIAAIRTTGLDNVIQTRATSEKGITSDRPVSHVVGQYATIVHTIKGVPQIAGGMVADFDSEKASMQEPSFCRNPNLVPEYCDDCDRWLRAFGGEQYDNLCRWLAYSLAFDEGTICCLSIRGTAGAGKKLLAVGLSECLAFPAMADADDIIGEHGYGLLKSPFLLVDENWPIKKFSSHPADRFRSLVAGNSLTVRRKYLPPIQAINPVRVIFTANNLDVVKMLSGKRDLSPEDRQALAIRLFHIDIGYAATKFLNDRGGDAFTAVPGRQWIRPDGGKGLGDFILAKHFLWLHTQRHRWPRANRFLVEGNANADILFELRTQGGNSPLIIECVLKMLESTGNGAGIAAYPGMAVVDGRLFMLPSQVLDYFRAKGIDGYRERMTAAQVGNVFGGMSVGTASKPYVLKGREDAGRKAWAELDLELLLRVARNEGWACKVLERLVGTST